VKVGYSEASFYEDEVVKTIQRPVNVPRETVHVKDLRERVKARKQKVK
jgi:hypothetical protein